MSGLEAIKKLLPKKRKGLEIGVGTGRFANALGIATGVDLSKNMIEIAKKRGIDARLEYGEHPHFKMPHLTMQRLLSLYVLSKIPRRFWKKYVES